MLEHKMGQLELMSYVSALKTQPVSAPATVKPVDGKATKDKPETPSRLDVPIYLMNYPLTLSSANPNNVLMRKMSKEELKINHGKANSQWQNVYNYIASKSVVYLLPNMGNFQDQVYVANLGLYLPHIKHQGQDVIIVSNYKSRPRQGEERVGDAFFSMMKYAVFNPPTYWEGEAETKYVRDNIYIGGYGIRTDGKVYDWMEQNFNMRVVRVKETDEMMYHFDCYCFPLTSEKVFICTRRITSKEIKEIEKVCEIIDVPLEFAHQGFTNAVRVGQIVLIDAPLAEMKASDKDYLVTKNMCDYMEKVTADNGMETVVFCLSEYEKSGADLSCMVMNLSFNSYHRQIL